jgi:hypothetical protein
MGFIVAESSVTVFLRIVSDCRSAPLSAEALDPFRTPGRHNSTRRISTNADRKAAGQILLEVLA